MKYLLLILFLSISSQAYATECSDVVKIAYSEIGKGETIGDNKGPEVRIYMNGGIEGQPWCAGFVSYVFRKAGVKLPYIIRSRDFIKYGIKVSVPKPGDVIVFWRRSKSSITGHVGIISKVTADKIYTIEGNSGRFPAKVKEKSYDRHSVPMLLGFYQLCAS